VDNLASIRRASRVSVAAWMVKTWNAQVRHQRLSKGGLRYKERPTRDASGAVTCCAEDFPSFA
jgi:hypothetical protein